MFTKAETKRLNSMSTKICIDSVPEKEKENWGLYQELMYVKNTLARSLGCKDKKATIEGYIKGTKKRKDFGELEKNRILWQANQRLLELR